MRILNRCMDVLKYRCIVTTECWQIKKRNNKITNPLIFRRSGFTLIELVTVIALIVILTVISTPIYNSYASRARQTEGYLVLSTIRSAQDNYFNEYANYLLQTDSTSVKDGEGFTKEDTKCGINAKGNDYYKLFNINDGSIDIKIGFKAMVKAKYGNITLIFNRTTGATAI